MLLLIQSDKFILVKLKIEFYNLGTLHIIIGPGLVLGIFFYLRKQSP